MLPSIRKLASKIGRLHGTKKPVRGMEEKSHRRLHVDPLEERQLLSVSPGMVDQALVNQTTGAGTDLSDDTAFEFVWTTDQQMMAGQSVAVDNDGDFVVTWTRYDRVLDPWGNPELDPVTGENVLEANIYARYFTNEVQRISLPQEVTVDATPGYAKFSINYGGNEVQQLSFTSANEPFVFMQQDLAGFVTLGFDWNGDGSISAAETSTFSYDESEPLEQNRLNVQAAIRQLGPQLSDATVTAVTPRDFTIQFGDASGGQNMPQITVESNTSWTSGFMPYGQVKTIREPVVLANIPIHPTNPQVTANNIEYLFRTSTREYMGPIDFPPPDRIPNNTFGPYLLPRTVAPGRPLVDVTPLSATEFEVTFIGDKGKDNHPQMAVKNVVDERANPLADGQVITLKESSPEFRVNGPEMDDPGTLQLDVYDQTNASVAMDADGDFVITWQSEVSDSAEWGSVTDIYARRFSPVGYVDPSRVEFVQGVRALGGEFRVNSDTSGPQGFPDVGMDAQGNFVIAWQTGGQDLSFFNDIMAQRFDRDGNMIGAEWKVNTPITDHNFEPYVAMSDDGHFAIAWSRSDDAGYPTGVSYVTSTWAEIHAPDGSVLLPEQFVLGGGGATAAFDTDNNVIFATDALFDSDFSAGYVSMGVHAIMYSLYNAQGTLAFSVIRDEFRANSASFAVDSTTVWPGDQRNGQALLDADGDLMIAYEGFGPDVAEYNIDAYIRDSLLLNWNKNADARNQSATLMTQWAQLEAYNGLLRGESEGILYSLFDASTGNPLNILYSDNVANSLRDGSSHVELFLINQRVDGGSFTIRLFREDYSGYEDITIDIPTVGDPGVMDPAGTRDNIEAALEAAIRTGVNWPEDRFEGGVEVYLTDNLLREDTPWDVSPFFPNPLDDYYIFEVHFMGEAHDTYFGISLAPNGNNTTEGDNTGPAPRFVTETAGYSGTWQRDPSAAMEPDGDFVLVWLQDEETSSGLYSNTNICYRTFDESTDTAGPTVSDLAFANGIWIRSGAPITNEALGYTAAGEGAKLVMTFDEPMLVYTDAELDWARGIRDQYAINPASVSQANIVKARGIFDSVTNPENYELLRDGELFNGGVAGVQYGLSKAYELGLSAYPSNKWEAVLTLDGDMLETSGALQPLPYGSYVVRALNPAPNTTNLLASQSGLRDASGRALYHTGYTERDGFLHGLPYTSNSFIIPTSEGDVSSPGTFPLPSPGSAFPGPGDTSLWTPSAFPNSPQYTAQDADGDTVIVWTEDATGIAGIHARLYDANWTEVNNVRQSSLVPVREILVTSNPAATYASVARDADGDFVVTWSQKDADGWNVYARRYDALGNPLAGEFLVNRFTAGDQCFSTVAMDVEGKFVITWQSSAQDGSGWGVYAQQFSRDGQRLGVADEAQLLAFNGISQANYALDFGGVPVGPIAYDSADLAQSAQNVVDAFAAIGVTVTANPVSAKEIAVHFTGNDGGKDQPPILVDTVTIVSGQPWAEVSSQTLANGRSGEFRVNVQTRNDQRFPAIAMNATGDFVITWTTTGLNGDGPLETDVRARVFQWTVDASGVAGNLGGSEFIVNETTVGSQKWSSVAMDASGDFAITWTHSPRVPTDPNYREGAAGLQEVYARRYAWDGESLDVTPITFLTMIDPGDPGATPPVPPTFAGYSEFLVNTFVANTQQHSQIAMDADGDFVITWESFQDTLPGASQPSSFGIYSQRFVRNELIGAPGYGPEGRIGTEFRVHSGMDGAQRFPGISMDDTGDILIVWETNTGTGRKLLFSHSAKSTDDAGPMVTEVRRDVPGGAVIVDEDIVLENEVSKLVVTFGEEMLKELGPDGQFSIENPDNWQLTRAGVEMPGAIAKVEFSLNPATGKYEAVVTFDAKPGTPGFQALQNGRYELTVFSNVLDMFDNKLDGDFNGFQDDAGFTRSFIISTGGSQDIPVPPLPGVINGRTFAETPGAVAVDADGDHVVVWTAFDQAAGLDRVYAAMYDSAGNLAVLPGGRNPIFEVTDDPSFDADEQRYASVACDADGDFVVTWTNYRDGDADIYARRFSSAGEALGPSFRLNTYTQNIQQWSNVAMDVGGNFIVTWSSFGQEDGGIGDGFGIFARRFDGYGYPLAPEFQVNTTTAGNQQFASAAMSGEGEFVVVWQSDQNGIGDDIVARRFNADGSPLGGPYGGEFLVNRDQAANAAGQIVDVGLAGNQRYPDVAMTLDGRSFAVTWSSSHHNDPGATDTDGYAIFTKTFVDRDPAQAFQYQYGGNPVVFPDYRDFASFAWNFPTDPNEPYAVPSTVTDGLFYIPIQVTDSFLVGDLNVRVNIDHNDPSDLRIWLESPDGTLVRLVERAHADLDQLGDTAAGENGRNFRNTVFDDQAEESILDDGSLPPYTGVFQPQQPLATFTGTKANGTWKLWIWDDDPANDPDHLNPVNNGRDGGTFREAVLDFTPLAAASRNTQVNQTIISNQIYPSIAMSYQGEAIITWSGYGDRPLNEDKTEYGVFARGFFDGAPTTDEFRVNNVTAGAQWLSSVGVDADGNYVIVWTGKGAVFGSATDVYTYVSTRESYVDDLASPLVTGVYGADRTPIIEGGVLNTNGVKNLIVTFSERLSTAVVSVGGVLVPAVQSVANSQNWVLERNGAEIPGAITDIDFHYNPEIRKFEAIITIDGNGVSAGDPGLLPGDYNLTVRDLIEDTAGNALDGDFDGIAGTQPGATGHRGYRIAFSVSSQEDVYGPERRINTAANVWYEQRFIQSGGTGNGVEQSTRAVAVDHDGDYVVVWTSYGQDDPSDPYGSGVYMRMFDRNDSPLTGEILVNCDVAGNQRNASVAMDADGDFMIVWEGVGENGTWDIFGRRFNSIGNPTTPALLINTVTNGVQINPAVAMDVFGNAIVVWATAAQENSFFNDLRGQAYNFKGEKVGGEFQVNALESGLPGSPSVPGESQINPEVAMDDEGNFVVVWDHVDVQTNGVISGTSIIARRFLLDAVDGVAPQSGEFTVRSASQGIVNGRLHAARNAQVAMDHEGNFIVVWEEYVGDGYDIFFQSYNADGSTLGGAQQANMLVGPDFVGHQVNPSVAMDADGDFAVVWNGQGGRPDPVDPTNPDLVGNVDTAGVFLREYSAGFGATGTVAQAIAPQKRVNYTAAGIQETPTIAMQPDGDFIVVWSGQGVGDHHGIFSRRYDKVEDTAGPMVTDFTDAAGTSLGNGIQVIAEMNHIVVTFDEEMYVGSGPSDPFSVRNPANWIFTKDGQPLIGGIHSIEFGLDRSFAMGLRADRTNKWEAVIRVDGNGMGAGVIPLGEGEYQIIARNTLRDLAGNPLRSSGYNFLGSSSSRNFSVLLAAGPERLENSNFTTGPQYIVDPTTVTDSGPNSPVAVAADGDGDYVVVWTDAQPGHEGLYARLTYVDWTNPIDEPGSDRESSYSKPTPGPVDDIFVTITTNPTAREASVARDADGDFVAVWSQLDDTDGDGTPEDWNIYARRFTAAGVARDAQPFLVNATPANAQRAPAVAIDHDGDFVITWQSNAQDGSGYGIYAQRYAAEGYRVGGQNATQTLTFNSAALTSFTLTLDGKTTAAIPYTGNAYDLESGGVKKVEVALADAGISAKVHVVDSSRIRVEFIDTYGSRALPLLTASAPSIAVATTREGLAGEFRVNDVTLNNQMDPAAAMDVDGGFIITWTSFGQDPNASDTVYDGNIYGKLFTDFNFNIDFTNPTAPTGLFGTEFLVNENSQVPLLDEDGNIVFDDDNNIVYVTLTDIQPGHQRWSAVAMDMNGDFIVTWTSFREGGFGATGHNDVYARRYGNAGAPLSGAFRVNSTETGDQQRSQVSMDADGDFVIVWEGTEALFGDGSCGGSTDVNFGVFAQRYIRSGMENSANTGVNGEIGGQILVNGTSAGNQRFPSVALDDTGDFVVAWCGNGAGDNQGIFSRRFDKVEDNAGPTVADVIDATTSDRLRVYDGRVLEHDVTRMIVTFSEELIASLDPTNLDASIGNLDNWDLTRNGALLQDAIQSVVFGWNETTKKYEAEVLFAEPLTNGFYRLIIYDDVTDMYGNPLDGNYDGIPLGDFGRTFRINTTGGGSGGDPTQPIEIANGRTFPETPGAVAVDRDGDTFVAFTGSSAAGLDKAYVVLYDAFGNELGLIAVTDGLAAFADDEQRYVTVACDLDGDFVVTWTNYRDGEQDVFGRLFTATGQPKNDPFKINAYTPGNQKYSNVGMDAEGDFVVTWSSYGQEMGGAPGYGYGVYARRFDRAGLPLAPEFQVNVTVAGSQRHSSVAVDAEGGFIVAWQSSHNGIGDDIVFREFNADGSPAATPLTGEQIANVDTVVSEDGETFVYEGVQGNQRYPDVAISMDGRAYVITWASSGHDLQDRIDPITGEPIPVDNQGWAIFAKTFERRGRDEQILSRVEPAVPVPIPHMGDYSLFAGLYPDDVILANGAVGIPINVNENFRVDTLTLDLTVRHEDPSDLIMWLESPSGQTATLVRNAPSVGDDIGFTAAGPNGRDFINTTLDDLAENRIDDPDNALPPFQDSFIPVDLLSTFRYESAQGTWILWIQDFDPPGDPDEETIQDVNGNVFQVPRVDSGRFERATLYFTPSSATSAAVQVNQTAMGHQVYPSVAMDGSGRAVFTWSGYGNQPGEEDTFQYGVYSRMMLDGVMLDGERRLNEVPEGQQWLSSVGADADGNFVVAWTGEGRTPGSDTSVYTYFSVLDAELGMNDDFVGPLVSGAYDDGDFLRNGATLTATDLTSLVVAFDESMSTHTTGPDRNPVIGSIENLDNWVLERNGSEIQGAVKSVRFGYNSATRRWEAVVTFDNNGISPGEGPLQNGQYVLTVRDLVTDQAGNRLDADFDGSPGTLNGAAGYAFRFNVSFDDRILGPEFRVNPNSAADPVANEQRLGEPGGTGLARESSNRSVAIDHDGDYAVVWTGYHADGTTSNVFYAVYNSNDALINSGQVNRQAGVHRNASISMDADGDFVVVWQGLVPDGDGNPDNDTWNVYAQRFDAVGNRLAADATEGRPTSDSVWGTSSNAFREIQVNTEEANDQVHPAVAMDEYGNFIVTWVTTGQAFSYFNDIKAQAFDYRGFLLGNEFRVNSADLPGAGISSGGLGGPEVNPTVAMDSFGHVVFAWEQITAQTNGVVTNTDIMARRFSLAWNPDIPDWFFRERFIVAEDLVEFVASDGDLAPDDATHEPEDPTVGGSPGEVDIERVARNPQVAMDKYGNFTIVWESFRDNDLEGGDTESYGIYYNRFGWDGTPLGESVQQANLVITLQDDDSIDRITASEMFNLAQVNPSVAIDADGDFVIAWNGKGAEPDPLNPENWQLIGNQDDAGVFMRKFHAASYSQGVDLNGDGIPEFALDTDGDGIFDTFAPDVISAPVGPQRLVNYTTAGIQQHPTVAMQPDGSYIVVWAGNGVGDENGIFVRRFKETTDTAGPIVTELRTLNGALIYDYDTIFGSTGAVKVVFSEQVRAGTTGFNSVENVNNWGIMNGQGEEIPGGIASVSFGYDSVLGKWVAQVNFNRQFLPDGEYTLFARTRIQDIAGNPLARTGFRPGGTGEAYGYDWNYGLWYDGSAPYTPVPSLTGGMGFTFRMKSGNPTTPVDGDSDERFTSLPLFPIPVFVGDDDTGGTGTGGTTGEDGTVTVTEEYILSVVGDHENVAIDRNNSGDYVAVWTRETLSQYWATVEYTQDTTGGTGGTGGTGDGTTTTGEVTQVLPVYQTDIVAMRFDRHGRPIGTEFVVNSWIAEAPYDGQFESDNNQVEPDVAIADDGSFVVVWSGDGELIGDQTGVFGQKFDASGIKIGGNFRINVTKYERQSDPSIGMNPTNGQFVVSWTSYGQDGSGDGVFHRLFNANCTPATGFTSDVRVNTRTSGGQNNSDVSMDRWGNYVIVWQSDGQDGSQWGVYGQKYLNGGGAYGAEFRLNQTTQYSQYDPQVAMHSKPGVAGFVVTWTTFGQDGSDDAVYARVMSFDASITNEFRVNQTTARRQFQPDVAMNFGGTFVVSWTGWDKGNDITDDTGVYARLFDANGNPLSNEFRLNAITDGDQHGSAVSIDNDGNVAAAWSGPNWMETNWVEPNWYKDGTWWFDPTWVEPDYPESALPSPSDFMGLFTRVFGLNVNSLIVQPEARESFVIPGTAGEDHFEFISAATSGACTVRVTTSGQTKTYTIPQGVTTVKFTGLGGNDTATITGTSAKETFRLQPNSVGASTFEGGPVKVEVYETETIHTIGGGGADHVVLTGSSFGDTIAARPSQLNASRKNAQGQTVYSLQADGFTTAEVVASAGDDTLKLYDLAYSSQTYTFKDVLTYERLHTSPVGLLISGGVYTVVGFPFSAPARVRMDGSTVSRDYGDLANYAVVSKQIREGFRLGSGIDAETAPRIGEPDDGVAFGALDLRDATETITVSASAAGVVSAWIDFDKNGVFDADERILNGAAVAAGTNRLSFNWADIAGAETVDGAVARVIFTDPAASDVGEVEDYTGLSILNTAPSTIDTSIPGDLNGDGMVNSGDLDVVRANWGRNVSAGDASSGDSNGDGVVNSGDLDIIRSNWGQVAPSTIDTSIPGDLNGDGMVNSGDLDVVRANWGRNVSAGDATSGDSNGDGVVNSGDLDIIRSNWGQVAPAAAAAQAPMVAPMEAEPAPVTKAAEPVYGPRRREAAAVDVLFDGLEVTPGSETTIAELAWAFEIENLRAKRNGGPKTAAVQSADRFFQMLGDE